MGDDQTPSGLPSPPNADRFGFAWDIAMALRRTPLFHGRGQPISPEDKMALAQTILDHFQISGVILSRKPPLDGHGRRPAAPDNGQ